MIHSSCWNAHFIKLPPIVIMTKKRIIKDFINLEYYY